MMKLTEAEKLDFFNRNQKLINYQLKRFKGYMGRISYQDLFQEACLSTWNALNNYDSETISKKSGKPVKLSVYVSYSIMGDIQKYIGSTLGCTSRTFRAVSGAATTNDAVDVDSCVDLALEVPEYEDEIDLEFFLKGLRPMWRDCFLYNYGLSDTIDRKYLSIYKTIAELTLIKIKHTHANNLDYLKEILM